jgi:hypothetical protein
LLKDRPFELFRGNRSTANSCDYSLFAGRFESLWSIWAEDIYDHSIERTIENEKVSCKIGEECGADRDSGFVSHFRVAGE